MNFSDLERAVEELSELIESPIDPEGIKELRQKVTDKTVSSHDHEIPLRLILMQFVYLGLRAQAQ